MKRKLSTSQRGTLALIACVAGFTLLGLAFHDQYPATSEVLAAMAVIAAIALALNEIHAAIDDWRKR